MKAGRLSKIHASSLHLSRPPLSFPLYFTIASTTDAHRGWSERMLSDRLPFLPFDGSPSAKAPGNGTSRASPIMEITVPVPSQRWQATVKPRVWAFMPTALWRDNVNRSPEPLVCQSIYHDAIHQAELRCQRIERRHISAGSISAALDGVRLCQAHSWDISVRHNVPHATIHALVGVQYLIGV